MRTEQGRETSPVGRVAFKAMEGRLAPLVGSTPASSANLCRSGAAVALSGHCRYSEPMNIAVALVIATATSLLLLAGLLLRPARTH